jgi:hypothetical protein
MSNYSKVTDFAAKDSLSTGNPAKIVKGVEIDDELTAISGAIASKADLAGPTFTGTPSAPTASYGTNTTQLATTAFVQAALVLMYPVGSVYTNISVSTNPATLFGFGTWVAITGRVIVGLDASDSVFDTVGETGGSKDAVVVSHNHNSGVTGSTTISGTFTTASNNGFSVSGVFSDGGSYSGNGGEPQTNHTVNMSAPHTHTISSEGVSGTNANLQPYVVAYVWKRTA